jgi:hypothetical protein
VRNKLLCEARLLAKNGFKHKADLKAAKAAEIAPLTQKEQANIEAAYAYYLGVKC